MLKPHKWGYLKLCPELLELTPAPKTEYLLGLAGSFQPSLYTNSAPEIHESNPQASSSCPESESHVSQVTVANTTY